jgi:hypothetical protein
VHVRLAIGDERERLGRVPDHGVGAGETALGGDPLQQIMGEACRRPDEIM